MIKFRDVKLQYEVNLEAAKTSGKIDKCEYLRGEEILPINQSQMTEHTKFTLT